MFSGRRKTQCGQVRSQLSEYLDKRLSTEESDVVKRHIESCKACAEELKSLQMTVHLLHDVPLVKVPRSFTIREAEVTREAEQKRWFTGWLRPAPVPAAYGARTASASIFDPWRLRWLRPAAVAVTFFLVLLLVLDFLQVIPNEADVGGTDMLASSPEQTLAATYPEGEVGGSVIPDNEGLPPVPGPLPSIMESKGLTNGNLTDKYYLESARSSAEVADESEKGWPLRPIEIALGVVVFMLVGIILYSVWRRRRWETV